MNTISFSNAFKSLMATLGAKTTDSNYAVPLVNKTSGAPQGFMDMSSLASVLGGLFQKEKGTASEFPTDLNLLYNQTQPYMLVWLSSAGAPDNVPFSGLGLCLTLPYAYGVIQCAVKQHIGSDIYIREYWAGSSNSWTEWKSIALT